LFAAAVGGKWQIWNILLIQAAGLLPGRFHFTEMKYPTWTGTVVNFGTPDFVGLKSTQNIWIANESFENVAKFKYLRTTLTDQNDIHDEIKSRLNSGNACYYSVQNLLFSHLIS
jgi:hypothetical protein